MPRRQRPALIRVAYPSPLSESPVRVALSESPIRVPVRVALSESPFRVSCPCSLVLVPYPSPSDRSRGASGPSSLQPGVPWTVSRQASRPRPDASSVRLPPHGRDDEAVFTAGADDGQTAGLTADGAGGQYGLCAGATRRGRSRRTRGQTRRCSLPPTHSGSCVQSGQRGPGASPRARRRCAIRRCPRQQRLLCPRAACPRRRP